MKQEPVRVPNSAVQFDQFNRSLTNIVLATVYVNLTKHGKARPFVGVGVGVNLHRIEQKQYVKWYADSDINEKVLFGNRPLPVVKGVVGLNFYPTKHFVLSLSGGFINGPALSLGTGFTF